MLVLSLELKTCVSKSLTCDCLDPFAVSIKEGCITISEQDWGFVYFSLSSVNF